MTAQYCPICSEQMKNITGNIYTCEDCDYTATDHQLERVYAQIRTKNLLSHTTGA